MPVRLNSSGGGSVTLDVPAVGTTTTLNLPTANGTLLASDGSGNVTVSGAATFSGNATFNAGLIPSSSFLRNRIINGDMRIDQRNAGAAVTYTVPVSPFITDRWSISIFGSTYPNPIMTAQQVTDAPATFTNSLRVTSSATITPDANRLGAWFEQKIEGFNIADFAWGTASASAITISFWVKASRTGTVSISLENSALDRSYLTTATVLAANTWERKTVTIPGDTSGTWLTNNGIGLSLKFGIMSNGTWFAGAGGSWTGTRTLLSSSQTNFIALSGDNIAITGVQLEVGSVATPFERRQFGQELSLCQRYFTNWVGVASSNGFRSIGVGYVAATTSDAVISIPLSATMRTTPTASFSGAVLVLDSQNSGSLTSIVDGYLSSNSTYWLTVRTNGAMVTGRSATMYTQNAATSIFNLSAEL